MAATCRKACAATRTGTGRSDAARFHFASPTRRSKSCTTCSCAFGACASDARARLTQPAPRFAGDYGTVPEIPEGSRAFFRLSPGADGEAQCFAVRRGDVEKKFEVNYWLPDYRLNAERIEASAWPIVNLVNLTIGRVVGLKDGPGGWSISRSEYVEDGIPVIRAPQTCLMVALISPSRFSSPLTNMRNWRRPKSCQATLC